MFKSSFIPLMCLAGLAACGNVADEQRVYDSWIGTPKPRPEPFLNFPPEARAAPLDGPNAVDVPGFPRLLSETGAFADTARATVGSGMVPYEIQAPLWSDGAAKRRWMALPEGEPIAYSDTGPWRFPEGTVFVKHFEMAMDEREPAVTRRLETRFWIAARQGGYYGATYRWNADQTDAEIVLSSETEELTIIDANGEARQQSYFYPGPRDCFACHNAAAGYVLGPRTAQLNRERIYRDGIEPTNQLVAWSGWGLLDTSIDNTTAHFTPRLAAIDDETETPEQRVRSYWDGNCSMCHAGENGPVPGWDARYSTDFEAQGLYAPPRREGTSAAHLITPGDPSESFIYLRGETVEVGLRMPPLGRNRVDSAYVELLARWISELE